MTLLAPRDVARRLGLSTSRVIQLDREGRLSAMRDSSGRRLYDPEVVRLFAIARDEQRALAAQPAAAHAHSSDTRRLR
jgi:DNA-binding transcriptional MerR regulator